MKLGSMIMLLFVALTGCKKTYDEPPYPEEPQLEANITIAQLLAKYQGSPLEITEDLVLKALVVGDDKSGNIFKKIFVQDQTGGLDIEIDANNIHNNYPTGSWVYIKAKGLTLGTYNGLLELGLGINTSNQPVRIPGAVIDKYLVKSYAVDVMKPVQLSINQLDNQYLSMLVELKDVQFDDSELSKTYANATNPASTQNRIVKDCNGNQITLRMSDYANFAGEKVARGKGSLVGIYTIFGTTKQFMVRDLEDMKDLTGDRCDGSSGGGDQSGSEELISISELRSKLAVTSPNDTEVKLPANTKIKGIVVSSIANESQYNLRVQEKGGAGILVYVSSGGSNTFNLGQEVEINTSAQSLIVYNGDLELKVPLSNIKAVGTGAITPKTTTITEINSNINNWTSTVVKLENLTVTKGASNSSGLNYTLTATDGSIVTFVRTTSGIIIPDNLTSITGYLSLYNGTKQLTVRTAADVVAGTGNPNPGGGNTATSLTEDFSTLTAGGNTASTGDNAPSGTKWSGNENFPTVESAYPAGGMVKLGTASLVGSITSKKLDLSGNGGNFKVKLDVKGWSAASGQIVVKTSYGQEKTVSFTAKMGDPLETYTLDFTGGTSETTVTISTISTSLRAFIDNVSIAK